MLPLGGDRKPFPFVQSQFNEKNAVFSPDARWLAYQSDESGRHEICVMSFPTAGGKRQVSLDGGVMPKWQSDAKAIYYLKPGAKLTGTAVVENGSAIALGGRPRTFPGAATRRLRVLDGFLRRRPGRQAVSFLDRQESAPMPVTLVTNCTAEVTKQR